MPRSLGWLLVAIAVLLAFCAWIARGRGASSAVVGVLDASPVEMRNERLELADAHTSVAVAAATRSTDTSGDGASRISGASAHSVSRVEGRVTGGRDGTAPMRGADVRMWRARTDGEQSEHETRTDEHGRYAVDGLGPGTWFVAAEAERHAVVVRPVVVHAEDARVGVDVELPARCVLAVQLVDRDGPVASYAAIGVHESLQRELSVRIGAHGAREVSELDPVMEHESRRRTPDRRVVAADLGVVASGSSRAVGLRRDDRAAVAEEVPAVAVGRFAIDDYARATDALHLVLGDRVVASRPMPVVDGPCELYVDAAMVQAVASTLAVRVRDARDGRGVPDARVRFVHGEHEIATARTDESGVAACPGIPPVKLVLRVDADGFVRSTQRLPRSRADEIVVELTAGSRLAGRITTKAQDARMAIWRVRGDDAPLGPPAHSARVVDGEFDLGCFEPGRYALGRAWNSASQLVGADVASSPALLVVDVGGQDLLDLVVPWVETDPSPSPSPFTVRRTTSPGLKKSDLVKTPRKER